MADIPPPPRQVGNIDKDFPQLFQYASDLAEALDAGAAAPEVGRAPRGWIDGLQMSTDGITLSVTAGLTRSTDDEADINIGEAIAGKTWARFEPGAGNGMLDDGSVAGNSWYHIFAVANPNDNVGDILASLSIDEPAVSAGFTKFRRVGSIRTGSGAAIRPFVQRRDTFLWSTPTLDLNAAISTSRTLVTLNVPPGLPVQPLFNNFAPTGSRIFYISSPEVADVAPSITAAPLISAGINGAVTFGGGYPNGPVWTDAEGRIAVRAGSAGGTLRLATLGWIDPRGRDL